MDHATLNGKGEGELQKLLKAEREKLRDLRFRIVSRQLKDVRELRETRRTIARILTILNVRKRGGEAKTTKQEQPTPPPV